ncbi:hypothetical protein ACFLZX_01335 [Nanoarchaeota archaeon]
MKSKGQVTIFIILGLLVLISVGLIIFFRTIPEEGLPYEIKSAEELPDELQPVSLYVTSCLNRIGLEALLKIGNRGGYIFPENFGITSVTANPTAGGAVQFSTRSPLKIPFWFHLKSDNSCSGNCEFEILRPPLRDGDSRSVESQLSDYISNNIERCTGDFEIFNAQGMNIVKIDDIITETVVTENDVSVKLYYPLRISQNDVSRDVNEFVVNFDLNLKDIYELASLLTELEIQYKYLENDVLNLIAAFSNLDNDALPPRGELEFGYGRSESWTKSTVKNNIQGMMMSYIPMLKVTNTSNYELFADPTNPVREAMYNLHQTIPLNQSFSNLEVRFTYLDFWPIYFDLNCDGELCTAESASHNFLRLIGIQRYNFLYDVSFPVMIEIFDNAALNGQGYVFRYFLEGNIRDNRALKTDYVALRMLDMNPNSLLCRESSRNSGDVLITAKEGDSFVDGVEVSYSCGTESCAIGTITEGTLLAKFPICIGGVVALHKEGYIMTSQFLSTKLDEPENIEIQMTKLSTIDIEIQKKKVLLSGGSWVFDNTAHTLGSEEYGIVTISRVGDILEEGIVRTVDYYPGENVSVELAPGDYEIDVNIFTDEDVLFPSRRECEGGILGIGEECYTIDAVQINDTFPNGGSTIEATISQTDLEKNKMIVYAVSPSILDVPVSDRKIEMMEQLSLVGNYSEDNAADLRPRYT